MVNLVVDILKRCSRCKQSMSLDLFKKDRRKPCGCASICLACHKVERRSETLKAHGLTIDMYTRVLATQNNVCAVCKHDEVYVNTQSHTIQRLSVDLDKATGKLRGLLCRKCKRTLSCLLHDDAHFIASLHHYLRRANK